MYFFADNVVAQLNAFIADENGRSGDKLAHLMLALAAKGTIQQLFTLTVAPAFVAVIRHSSTPPHCRETSSRVASLTTLMALDTSL